MKIASRATPEGLARRGLSTTELGDLIMLLFLGHDFWTRNVRKPIKGSEDSDSSLVSNTNLSEILPSSAIWAQGQATWSKMTWNLPHLWRHSQKNPKPKTKNFFFIVNWKTCPSLLRVWTAL